MNISRRAFLQASAGGTALLFAAAAGLLPRFALAATEAAGPVDPRKQFEAHTLDEVVKALGGSTAQKSAEIDFQAPEIAENGAVVPLVVTSKLPGTRMIAIVMFLLWVVMRIVSKVELPILGHSFRTRPFRSCTIAGSPPSPLYDRCNSSRARDITT